jgi:hypothetical protein
MRITSAFVAIALFACTRSADLGGGGRLTWTARLDNTDWTPEKGGYTVSHLTRDGYLLVAAFRRDSLGRARDAMGVKLVSYSGPGRYELAPDPAGNVGIYSRDDPTTGASKNFFSTRAHSGELWITDVDTVAHRIAGRVSFEAQEEGGSHLVTISDGVFRIAYDTVRP